MKVFGHFKEPVKMSRITAFPAWIPEEDAELILKAIEDAEDTLEIDPIDLHSYLKNWHILDDIPLEVYITRCPNGNDPSCTSMTERAMKQYNTIHETSHPSSTLDIWTKHLKENRRMILHNSWTFTDSDSTNAWSGVVHNIVRAIIKSGPPGVSGCKFILLGVRKSAPGKAFNAKTPVFEVANEFGFRRKKTYSAKEVHDILYPQE